MVVPRVPLAAAALPASTGMLALSNIRMASPLLGAHQIIQELPGNRRALGRAGNKSQRRFIDAVAQIRRLGAVVKHVAEVRVASDAVYLGAFFRQRKIGARLNVLLGDRRPKARPAGFGIKFGVRAEN